MDRREFITRVGLGTAAIVGGLGSVCAGGLGSSSKENSKTATSSDRVPAMGRAARVASLSDAGFRRSQGFDPVRVKALLERTIAAAFDAPGPVDGLRTILSEKDTVGLKLNCLAGKPLAPSTAFIGALVELLEQAGVTRERIILFERGERDLKKGGFTPNDQAAPRVVGHDSRGIGYEKEPEISGSVGSCLSRVLTQQISVLINIGVLKDHSLAGVSAGMKNLYGLIHNPNRYHDNLCDPYVADVLAFPVVQRKLKLTLLDASTAQCQGGPGFVPDHSWELNGMLASTDPVALDRVAWELIEIERKRRGLPTLKEDKREPIWIASAAARGLGQDSLERITWLRE